MYLEWLNVFVFVINKESCVSIMETKIINAIMHVLTFNNAAVKCKLEENIILFESRFQLQQALVVEIDLSMYSRYHFSCQVRAV